jgi:hypothetical protein
MADPIKVTVDDGGIVWVTLKGRDGRPVTGHMSPEDAEALGRKLTIAIEHFRSTRMGASLIGQRWR